MMSEEGEKAFVEKAGEDQELQEKLKGAISDERFLAIAKAAGFDFTKEEWLSATPKVAEDELSESDLAAGGGHGTFDTCPESPHTACAKAGGCTWEFTLKQCVCTNDGGLSIMRPNVHSC